MNYKIILIFIKKTKPLNIKRKITPEPSGSYLDNTQYFTLNKNRTLNCQRAVFDI